MLLFRKQQDGAARYGKRWRGRPEWLDALGDRDALVELLRSMQRRCIYKPDANIFKKCKFRVEPMGMSVKLEV
ncbi:MAG: hypothetical protein DRP56_06350 [Planctomycetota bacterium]|nr:MAG: hypothetical protein DRP56_06350 [Planctomycetota bacterium]